MKMYTAGYTGHDGYPVTLAEGDSIGEVIRELPFTVPLKDNFFKVPDKDDVPQIAEAIQKHEGASGWVRQAPYSIKAVSVDMFGGYETSAWHVSGASLRDVVSAMLERSTVFEEQAIKSSEQVGSSREVPVLASDGTKPSVAATVSIDGGGVEITDILVPELVSRKTLSELAFKYSNPEDNVNDVYVYMSPTTEVEYAARQVEHAEKERLKAVRRASDEGVSQRVLASLAGVSQATIGRWLKDGGGEN